MTETKKRIRTLKKQLPSVKARVAAMAMSLLLAVAMLTSVSFAWFTMSSSPELGGVRTIIAANGNLEVALSDYDGLAPDRSGVGDSFSADSQSVHAANTSWGNLINLSGNYGIENLILRPAKLDTSYSALLTGVQYSGDGRYESTATDFGFTSWALDAATNRWGFLVPQGDAYGVRAISSVGYAQGEGKSPLQIALDNANGKNSQSKTLYEALMDKNNPQGSANLTVINNLVQAFVNEQLGSSTANFSSELSSIYTMLNGFYASVNSYGEALVGLANIQQRVYCEGKGQAYTPYTLDTLIGASAAKLSNDGVSLSTLTTFKTIEENTRKDLEKIQGFIDAYKQEGTATTWEDMYPIVQHLIDLDKVTIGGMTLSEIKNDITGALGILSGTQPVVISGGNMFKMEQLTGARMNANGPVEVKVKALFITINGSLYTSLTPQDTALYRGDEDSTKNKGEVGDFKGAMQAQDTYGMILDLWVRTNAANSYLALDGLLDVEIYYEQYQGKVLINGEVVNVPLWTYEYKTGNIIEVAGQRIEETAEMTVYQIPQSLDPEDPTRDPIAYEITVKVNEKETKQVTIYEGIFYDYKTDDAVYVIGSNGQPTETLLNHTHVEAYLETKENVLGFRGSNRVDDGYGDALAVGEVSATQGSGSCYIFYADTPEAATEAKDLLRNLKLAFLDVNNTVLARAEMDVDHMLEEGGKYIVPIVVTTSSYVVEGVNCIMPLEQNVATRVSVLVYLDGTGLENSMVMSKDSIMGSLNLQFASSEKKLKPMTNMDLESQTIALSAQVAANRFNYDGQPKTTELKANIYGVTPNSVLAYFQRQVNSSQGSRMDAVVLQPRTGADGEYWGADAAFTTPGTYVLRSLVIDGVEYSLPEPVVVTVEGLQLTYVSFSESMALTANTYVDREIELAIQADADTRPDKVQVRFKDENNHYTSATLSFDPNSISAANPYGLWKGTVRFTSSQTYTLTYVVMDGQYSEVPTTLQRKFTAYMGLSTRVFLIREGGLTFKYRGPQNVAVRVDIITDRNETMKSLSDVNLYYTRRGATSLANCLHAELNWENGQYVGTMNVDDIGTFVFAQLSVGENLITVAQSAPTIVSQPTEPPAFMGSALFKDGADVTLNDNKIMVLNDDSNLYYRVETKNATTAYKVVLVLKDAFNNNHEVIIEEGVGLDGHSYLEDNTYYFAIPDTMAVNRNGKWTVTGLKLYGVYDESGNYYGEANPADPETVPYREYFALDQAAAEFTLIDEFAINVPTNTITLGKDANGKITASFMQAQSVGSAFTVGIDFGGMSLPAGLSISDPVLTLYHNATSSATNGGYSYTTSKYSQIVCPLTWDAKEKTYVTASDVTIYLAGTYYAEVSFNLLGATNEAIKFTKKFESAKLVDAYSVAPSVEITAASYAASSGGSVTISDKKAVTVYFKESQTTNCGKTIYKYTSPEVDMKLSGSGYATAAKLTFANTAGGDVYLYKTGGSQKTNSDITTSFEWSGDGTVKRYVGMYTYRSSSSSNDEKLAAGTLTATGLELTFGGETYTVDMNITISNPS